MTTGRFSDSLRKHILLSTFASAPLYLADLVGTAHFLLWIGKSREEWLGTAATCLVYWSFIFVTSLALNCISWLVPRATSVRTKTPLITSLIAIGLLYGALNSSVDPKVQAPLDVGFAMSAFSVLLFGCLSRVARFSTLPSLFAVVGAVVGATLNFQCARYTAPIGMPGLEIGLRASIFYACALGIGAIAAGFIGARHKSTGYGVALLVWTLGIGGPAFSMAQADTRATATKNIGPNILLLTADTMRADYMSVYNGVAPTPALEALAEGGAKFEQAYSLAPWTIPSLSGLFSSKYPPGISPHLSDEESEDELTLYGEIPKYWLGETSESIVKSQRTRGYRTGVAMGNYGMIQQDWPLGQFEERVTLPFWPMMYLGPFSESAFLSDFLRSMAPSLYERRPGDTTRAIAELAHRFIRYQHGEQFFFWAHFLDPHSPYHPPNGFRTQEGPFAAYPFINKKSDGLERDYIRSLYANEISYVDSAMGKVLSLLGELNMDDQTYTVMTSDHGEELWDRGRIGHGQTLFDEQLHVPLIIKGPGVTAQTIKGSVSAIDIIPTIAVWTDTPHDPEWRGKSLARSLEGKRARQVNRVVFAQATGLLPKPVEPLQAVIIGNHKLVRGVESGKTQLFGRARDPGETKDISKRNPAVVRQLKRELRRWTESFPETFEQFRNEDEAPEPDAEMLEYLRALGYLPSEAP